MQIAFEIIHRQSKLKPFKNFKQTYNNNSRLKTQNQLQLPLMEKLHATKLQFNRILTTKCN